MVLRRDVHYFITLTVVTLSTPLPPPIQIYFILILVFLLSSQTEPLKLKQTLRFLYHPQCNNCDFPFAGVIKRIFYHLKMQLNPCLVATCRLSLKLLVNTQSTDSVLSRMLVSENKPLTASEHWLPVELDNKSR